MYLTKITTPFGLLDEATQKALRECGGPYQRYCGGWWEDCGINESWLQTTYRLKPQPPKPREFCVELDDAGFAFRVHEDGAPIAYQAGHRLVFVREVIE